MRRLGQAEAFELDVGPARAVEQPDAVAEQHPRDAHEDLVDQTRVEALDGRARAEDVDVLVTRGGLRRGDAAVQVPTNVTPGTGVSDAWWVSTN